MDMKPEKLIEVLSVAERLKDAVRHCYTSGGRRELRSIPGELH